MEDIKTLVYVLAPTQEKLEIAREEYKNDTWAKPILLPQDQPYLESYMYTHYLMEHYDEWKDMDYVGCISWSAKDKQPRVHDIGEICRQSKENDSEFVALMYRGDLLVKTAEKWHPTFTKSWLAVWNSLGWVQNELLLNDSIPSFYCNYWITTPKIMRAYCSLMGYLAYRIETNPSLKHTVWYDSGYHWRGDSVAKMTEQRCRDLFGVSYYPMIVFVMERMICLFASVHVKKFTFMR